ncbi:peptide ABC transporter ATP-binding protein [Paenibacillus baekrokdamisoli]|uniref:Peptide ABC transporter ATP-binding protein n=1 Tax=Paenibacillus baekrokdamisoli TaxID=1712516 RepID=A0A3G9JK95_9BACL|nr:amino acid ABC transporter ATP-binding protein [Paenibacillus baekrokdamisoli]MBB3068636.1 polar amino acid transport system ATP-binding protein [Paenibacillus baekrokdamisoli]BBH23469.1 peptide ABC transporter ATP-binding protein [Paenibacillus baekrokdamisoli]
MIKVEKLSKSFGKQTVLHDISTTITQGEVVAVIGPSGSGKSTFLRCLNLLESPTSGRITINDKDITDPKTNILQVRQKIGMVFQHFHLFPHMNVIDNICFAPMKVKGWTKEQARSKALELLERVGLTDKSEAFPSKLSGGQKQRVAILRSLAMEPEIMLFDEPTSALDPEMVKEVLEVIRGLAESGMTMVIVTHEMRFAQEAADTIYFLDKGHLVEKAPPAQFFKRPDNERARQFLEKVL